VKKLTGNNTASSKPTANAGEIQEADEGEEEAY